MLRKLDSNWPRREHYEHYMNDVRCTYSFTVQIDITPLQEAVKSARLKIFPAQVYALARVVNSMPELRMGIIESGEPGVWDIIHPGYTVFNPETKLFAAIWTLFDPDFGHFYTQCTQDIACFSVANGLCPKKDAPPNMFDISSIPSLGFTAFNLNIYTPATHLPPIFTIGRHERKGGKTYMPLAVQLHHAACDGYHAGLFVQSLEDLLFSCRDWLV